METPAKDNAESPDWPPRRLIRSVHDECSALGLGSLSDLEDYIEAYCVDVGKLCWHWEELKDSIGGGAHNSAVGTLSFEMRLPMTRRKFYAELDLLNDRLEHRLAAAELPTTEYCDEDNSPDATRPAYRRRAARRDWLAVAQPET